MLLCTVSPEYAVCIVEHIDTSLESIHLMKSSYPSLIHLIVPLQCFLVGAFSFVVGAPLLLSLYVPHATIFKENNSL